MHLGFFSRHNSTGHTGKHGSSSEGDSGTSGGVFNGHLRILDKSWLAGRKGFCVPAFN
jgi:hypothetical protein